ncbi:hypothetical protein D3C79_735550 [compost metagenome]
MCRALPLGISSRPLARAASITLASCAGAGLPSALTNSIPRMAPTPVRRPMNGLRPEAFQRSKRRTIACSWRSPQLATFSSVICARLARAAAQAIGLPE